MFEYLQGTLISSQPDRLILDVQGIGYLVFISLATYSQLPAANSKVKIYTSLIIREDAHKIFGFLTLQERNFFEMLNEVSGIGPRLAVSILGHMTIDDLLSAIELGNIQAISKIPGIGKKISERLIVELRDKAQKIPRQKTALPKMSQGVVSDAISALIHLGYSQLDAQKAVQAAFSTKEKEPTLSELIALSLKK